MSQIVRVIPPLSFSCTLSDVYNNRSWLQMMMMKSNKLCNGWSSPLIKPVWSMNQSV
jgi:hypothetical protein